MSSSKTVLWNDGAVRRSSRSEIAPLGQRLQAETPDGVRSVASTRQAVETLDGPPYPYATTVARNLWPQWGFRLKRPHSAGGCGRRDTGAGCCRGCVGRFALCRAGVGTPSTRPSGRFRPVSRPAHSDGLVAAGHRAVGESWRGGGAAGRRETRPASPIRRMCARGARPAPCGPIGAAPPPRGRVQAAGCRRPGSALVWSSPPSWSSSPSARRRPQRVGRRSGSVGGRAVGRPGKGGGPPTAPPSPRFGRPSRNGAAPPRREPPGPLRSPLGSQKSSDRTRAGAPRRPWSVRKRH